MSDTTQHSAEVDIYLLVDGQRFEVASCLGSRCSVRNPQDLVPCRALLVISVDGQIREKPVYLRFGMSRDRREVEMDILSESNRPAQ
jgi:hypothetical protein